MEPVVWQTGLRLEPGTKDKYVEYQYYQISDADHKQVFWFLRDHREFLEENGFVVGKENLDKLIDVFDSWVDGYYLLHALVGNRNLADRFLNLAFNYIDVRKERPNAARWNKIFSYIIVHDTPKEVFIPLIEAYSKFFPNDEWDNMWLETCEWRIKEDAGVGSLILQTVEKHKATITADNINKMTNFIMGEVIKAAKQSQLSFDAKKIKQDIEKEISICQTQ